MMRSTNIVLSVAVAIILLNMAFGLTDVATGAPIVTIVDDHSSATFDLGSDAGMYDWNVSGVDHLVRQWFWYRIGPNGGQSPINAAGSTFYGLTDTNFDGNMDTLYVNYTGTQLMVEGTFVITGAGLGKPKSDIAELLKITNLTNQTMDLHFFQYVDLSLAGTTLNSFAQILGGNTAEQLDSGLYVSETVITPRPSHYQVDYVPNIYNLLTNGLPLTLNDSAGPVGPGDIGWAFEWDVVLTPAGSPNDVLLVSKDKQIVPEPATMGLLALGGLLALLRRRRAVA